MAELGRASRAAPQNLAACIPSVAEESIRDDEVYSRTPYANPEAAARRPVEIAASVPAGRIYIERVNTQFVALLKASKRHPEFEAGIEYAVEKGWLWLHESGTYLKLMTPGQDLLSPQ